ncbi:MAG TPA: hypothetical protein VEW25_12510 [Allosphingosinicella sp.]|nr:hypothetical protein [Allosphingosinicella sp.]
MESDHRYYLRRASEERRAAERAITAAARERHRELATLFMSKAEQRAATRSPAQQSSPQQVQLAT